MIVPRIHAALFRNSPSRGVFRAPGNGCSVLTSASFDRIAWVRAGDHWRVHDLPQLVNEKWGRDSNLRAAWHDAADARIAGSGGDPPTLEPAMRGARITHVLLSRKNLRRPFPPAFASRLEAGASAQSIAAASTCWPARFRRHPFDAPRHVGIVSRQSRRAIPATSTADSDFDRHDHVVFTLSNGATVTFNDPRRFGVMDLAGDGAGDSHSSSPRWAPSRLTPAFDAAALARGAGGQAHRAESGAARSACRGGARQHLCERSAASRRSVAAAAIVDDRHRRRPADAESRPPGGCDQDRPARGDRKNRNGRIAPAASVSTSAKAIPADGGLSRHDPATHAGRTLDVLLSGLPNAER